jgi:uncharacterized membrane protein (DUF4010 family)
MAAMFSKGWTKGRGGIILAAFLGGAYSSTVTTVVLSKRASQKNRPHLFSGAMLIASGVMYLRLAILVGLFNRSLMAVLAPAFLALACSAILVGWLWARRPDVSWEAIQKEFVPKSSARPFSLHYFSL